MRLEQFRIDNLNKLADFLENEITDEQFSITDYRKESDNLYAEFYSLSDCGSIGCAVGWSPFVIPTIEDDFGLGNLNFDKYCVRNLVPHISGFWDYMFSDEWRHSDNENDPTRLGTVERIREVTKGRITESDAYNIFNNFLREL